MKHVYKLTVYQKSLTLNKQKEWVNRWFRIKTMFYFTKKDAFSAFKPYNYYANYKATLSMKVK